MLPGICEKSQAVLADFYEELNVFSFPNAAIQEPRVAIITFDPKHERGFDEQQHIVKFKQEYCTPLVGEIPTMYPHQHWIGGN